MHLPDWIIVFGMFISVVIVAKFVQRYTIGVSDFLAANRSAGRYLLSVAGGAASLAAVNILASFEMFYSAGFVPLWWWMMGIPTGTICSMTGWLVYRFRETRAMTLAEFFEMRYSRNFRVFAGLICFISGIINFGIFPAIGARFFIYFCGLPTGFLLFGFHVSTFSFLMFILLVSSIYFANIGGQVAVIITDFLQGIFCNLVFIILIVFFLFKYDWSNIVQSLLTAEDGYSMINPFNAEKVRDFNIWYFLIMAFGTFYWRMSWQGSQAYNSSSLTPHDSKMSKILVSLRDMSTYFILFFIPVCAYTVLHHSNYSETAATINNVLSGIDSEQIRLQMTVPVTLSKILPVGILGCFCAAMMAALLSTYDSFLHSWASVLIQDVVLPLRKKPITTKQHLYLLRFAVVTVAVFAFIWSLLFQMNQHILMYQAITGAVFIAGSGACIIGGLYWKRGTTMGAWAAMIVGLVTSLGLFVVEQLWYEKIGTKFPIHGMYAMGISIAVSIISYVIFSLINSEVFNLDKMLHRGEYSDGDSKTPVSGLKSLKFTKEFSLADKIIYVMTVFKSLLWFLIFSIFSIYNLFHPFTDQGWAKYWKFHVIFCITVSILSFFWFLFFGLRDLKEMITTLKYAKRDMQDNGRVSIGEKE